MMYKYSWIYLLFIGICYNSYGQDTIRLTDYYKGLKTTEVAIGNKSYCFLFDTGGGETFVSPEIVNELGKQEYGCSTGIRMTGEKVVYTRADSVCFQMGNIRLLHEVVGVWDVMSVLPKEFKRIDGIISLKTFQNMYLTIDLQGNKLVVEDKKTYSKRTQGMKLLNCKFANGCNGEELNILTQVKYKGNYYWFLFDSGNIDALIMSDKCASTKGNKSLKAHDFICLDGMEDQVQKRDIIYNGVLNYEIISKRIYTINFKEKKVWVS